MSPAASGWRIEAGPGGGFSLGPHGPAHDPRPADQILLVGVAIDVAAVADGVQRLPRRGPPGRALQVQAEPAMRQQFTSCRCAAALQAIARCQRPSLRSRAARFKCRDASRSSVNACSSMRLPRTTSTPIATRSCVGPQRRLQILDAFVLAGGRHGLDASPGRRVNEGLPSSLTWLTVAGEVSTSSDRRDGAAAGVLHS